MRRVADRASSQSHALQLTIVSKTHHNNTAKMRPLPRTKQPRRLFPPSRWPAYAIESSPSKPQPYPDARKTRLHESGDVGVVVGLRLPLIADRQIYLPSYRNGASGEAGVASGALCPQRGAKSLPDTENMTLGINFPNPCNGRFKLFQALLRAIRSMFRSVVMTTLARLHGDACNLGRNASFQARG